MDQLAEFIRKHPWWQWLTRTPFSAKMTKYALSSVIAFGLSNLAFAVCYALGMGTTVPSVIAFFAAAIPNWIMNRRWAWQQTGRAPKKQIISYASVSAVVLFVTAFATGRVNHWIKYDLHVANGHGLRLLLITAAFVIINVILFFAKFAVYEFLIFPGRRGRDKSDSRGDGPRGPRFRQATALPLAGEPQVEREPALSSGPAA